MAEALEKVGQGIIKRPDPDDIIFSELNLERWPGLWATTDTQELRKLEKTIKYPDGSELKATLTIDSAAGTGTLTTESQKYYSALLMMRQRAWGPKSETAPPDRRFHFSLRQAARLLGPGKTKAARWGSQSHASVKRHIRKLARVNIEFSGSFWDARTERAKKFEGHFTVISDYFIAEERRFRGGTAIQLPLELGYMRLNPWIEDNLDQRYVAPVYFSERMAIKAAFAQQLYNHLNLIMTGQKRYQRRLKALFEEDFPEMGIKYPSPSKRKRVLARNLKHLTGRKISTGVLRDLRIVETTDGTDLKLVVKKEAFSAEQGDLITSQPADKLASIRAFPPPTDQQEGLIYDILDFTKDEHSRKFYALVVAKVPEQILRRFLSELKGEDLEGGTIRNRGALFTSKVKSWCYENKIELSPNSPRSTS